MWNCITLLSLLMLALLPYHVGSTGGFISGSRVVEVLPALTEDNQLDGVQELSYPALTLQ